MTAFNGFITGAVLGLVFWSAIGLAFIYDFHPVEARQHIDAYPDRYTWMCNTDTECETEAARRGLPVDRD